MKNLLAAVLILGLTPATFAAPVYCFSKSETNKYTVSINSRWTTANVKLNDEDVTFGNLACTIPDDAESNSTAILYCHSTDVADAGFSTALVRDNNRELTLELSETTYFGSNKLDTLTCVEAQH